VKIALDQLFLLGVLSTALHWLGARSEIARPLWSRTHGWLDKLLRCPACSGYWLGGLIALGGVHPFGDAATGWRLLVQLQLSGLAAMVLTPIFEGVMLWGLRESAIQVLIDESAEQEGADPGLTESGEITPNERPRPEKS
jgi:hypothetical protein